MKKIIFYLIILSSIATQSFATNSDKQELEELKKRIAILEEKTAKPDKLTINLQPNSASNEAQSVRIDGRLDVDAIGITKGKTSNEKNTIAMRRIWLGARGNIDANWNYRALIGFENNQTSVYDAFISYTGFKNSNILIGNFFENNGLEIATPSLTSSLMEYSTGITTFRQLRRTGVSINQHGQNWGTQFGIFGSSPNNSATNNKGNSFSARAYFTPIHINSHILHLGFNTTYRAPDSIDGSVRFNSRGDTNAIATILIDTGLIYNSKDYFQNMLEFRYQKDSFTLTSEYIQTDVNRKNGLKTLHFNGGYVTTSYFLTGEKFGYDIRSGAQTAISVNKEGAIELAARYSFANLNNADIKGGNLDSYDLGLNYYVNNNVKLMANYIINRVKNGTSVTQGKNPQDLMFRIQLNF